MSGEALAEAAARLVGAKFRLHGRDPAFGLDCVGVLAAALATVGRSAPLPCSYTLRTREPSDLQEIARACGLEPRSGSPLRGDVVFVRVCATQLHLLVALGPQQFVHAHAALRRVVLLEGHLAWPVIGLWRLSEQIGD